VMVVVVERASVGCKVSCLSQKKRLYVCGMKMKKGERECFNVAAAASSYTIFYILMDFVFVCENKGICICLYAIYFCFCFVVQFLFSKKK
jgi:hypothetical protein